MRKVIIAALGAACLNICSPAWAAENPFSEVPADHWAYDALSRLQAEGVIRGYGDGTFRGDQPITRYEIAQLVARAMENKDALRPAAVRWTSWQLSMPMSFPAWG